MSFLLLRERSKEAIKNLSINQFCINLLNPALRDCVLKQKSRRHQMQFDCLGKAEKQISEQFDLRPKIYVAYGSH
jgi:hypothetical protein